MNTGCPRGVPTEFLLPGQPGLVANSNVQGETRRDLQFILEEGLVLPEQREAIRRAEPETHIVEGAQHEICHGRPRTGSRKRGASCAVPTDQIEVDVHPLVSPFEGMRASNQRHRVAPLPVPVALPLGAREAQVELTGDIQAHAYTEITFIEIDAHVSRRYSPRCLHEGLSVHEGVGRFVQERRTEGVRVGHRILLHIGQAVLVHVIDVAARAGPMVVIPEIVDKHVVPGGNGIVEPGHPVIRVER